MEGKRKMENSERLSTIRALVYNECQANKMLQWFWNSHLSIVEQYAQELTMEQNANAEVVLLGVYLHDIARIRGKGEEEHDLAGAPIAEEIMKKFSYDGQIIQRVKGVILTHRCGERKPESLEEKILATADAMSHFRGDFYLPLIWHHYPNDKLGEVIRFILDKMERDFHDKIFFEGARAKIKPDYEALKRVFSTFSGAT